MMAMNTNNEVATKIIKISLDDVKLVTGKRESVLRFIRQESHCKINISHLSARQSSCKIVGSKADIEHALNLIRNAINNQLPNQIEDNSTNLTQKVVNIPLTKCGALIRKNGKTIKQLQETLNVEMSIPYGNNFYDTKPLQILGQQDKVNAACRIVEDFIKREDGKQQIAVVEFVKNHHSQKPKGDKQITTSTRVRMNKVKNILGENGKTLKEICRESGANIVLSNNHPLNEFIIIGTAAQVESGERLIRLKVNESSTKSKSKLQIDKNKTIIEERFRPTFECGICFETFYIDEGRVTCEANVMTLTPSKELHSICVACIRGYAHSAITDIPVAFGGTGLQCASPECKNILTLISFEFYLCDEDYLPLKLRLQEQCLADASLEDLVTCPGCGFKLCVPIKSEFYRCICGRVQCKSCPRLFNAEHIGKTCQQLDKEDVAKNISSQNLESKMSEAVIRKCHKCGIAFVKNEGCNKMQCRCGAKQCYVCRQKDISYEHFCRCGHIDHGKCSICNRTCKLFENVDELDQIRINELQRQQYEQQQEKPSTSKKGFFSKIARLFNNK